MPMHDRTVSTSVLSRGGPAIAVIAVHVLLIYGLVTSMGIVEMPRLTAPFETVFIEAPIAEEAEPEMEEIKPEIEQIAPVEQAMPEVQFDAPIAPPTDIALPPSDTAISATPAESAGTPRQLRTTNRIEPVYPSASRRMGEEGTVRLRVLVDERGRPKEVNVTDSSGFNRLDQAAIDAVKRWRFEAATDGSGPVTAWTGVAITFRLTDVR